MRHGVNIGNARPLSSLPTQAHERRVAMSDKTMPITGGCLCGEVRYESTEPPKKAVYCHCNTCKKARGGIFGIGAAFQRPAVKFTQGEPKIYKSSDFAERGFCGNCGAPLFLRYTSPGPYRDNIYMAVGSLDNPELVTPSYHIGVGSKVSWYTIPDDLPQRRVDEAPGLRTHMTAVAPNHN